MTTNKQVNVIQTYTQSILNGVSQSNQSDYDASTQDSSKKVIAKKQTSSTLAYVPQTSGLKADQGEIPFQLSNN